MPDIYKSGELIPEFRGSVKGGLTVVVHNYAEINRLRALCMLAGQPPENPLHAVYRALQSTSLNLEAWEMWQERRAVALPQWTRPAGSTDIIKESADVTVEIDLGLFAASEIGRNQGEEVHQLSVALSIPDPETNAPALLEYEGENPGLLFQKGSIRAVLIRETLKVAGFGIALWSGRGLAASRRADLIVEDMRSKALKIQASNFEQFKTELSGNVPDLAKLERIDKMDSDKLKGKQAVILFLHGLLSTDVGVFDGLIQGFIQSFNEEEEISTALISWPHDSLASIDANAITLQRWIQKVVGLDGPNVVFICHSRGGLLARSVAVKLCQGEQKWKEKWKEKIRGCVTFGTPHEGAELAEGLDSFLGTLLLVQALRGGNGFASLGDALYCLKNRALDGIEDLVPVGAKRDTFLKKLIEDESKLAAEGEERALKILAVGGKTPEIPWLSFWIDKAFGGTDQHDGVVRLESSRPALFRETEATDCNHFEYFGTNQVNKLQERVKKFLKEVLRPRGGQPSSQ